MHIIFSFPRGARFTGSFTVMKLKVSAYTMVSIPFLKDGDFRIYFANAIAMYRINFIKVNLVSSLRKSSHFLYKMCTP